MRHDTDPLTPDNSASTRTDTGPGPGPDPDTDTTAARQRLALAQTALLSALVAGTPAPEGFDRLRLRVQSRALAAKRADVIAKVAPELPEILGPGYRPAFLNYAHTRPMSGSYRRDALDFAAHLLHADRPQDTVRRAQLAHWWRERSGPAPLKSGRAARLRTRLRRLGTTSPAEQSANVPTATAG